MSKSESDILSLHVKETMSKLLKLHPKTPSLVVFFLAGRLPGEAQLHQKQLMLFGMICRLRDNILNKIAVNLLTLEKQSNKNWFSEIRSLCFTYNLPHPLLLLRYPPSKEDFKYCVKTNITDFWQSKLCQHSKELEEKSLKYFKPNFMSLSKPHPLYAHAVTSYQANKCVTVARLISGRFRSGSLLRHFFPDKISGICELCALELEDIPHIILPKCLKLQDKAKLLHRYAIETLSSCATAAAIYKSNIESEDDNLKVQFMIDPSVIPQVIAASQKESDVLITLFRFTTTWCHALVRARKKLLETR